MFIKMYYVKCSCIIKIEQNLQYTKKQQGSLVWSFLRNSYKCMAGVKPEWALHVVTLPPPPQEGNSYWDVGNSDLALICFWHPMGATIQGGYYSRGRILEGGGRLKKSQKSTKTSISHEPLKLLKRLTTHSKEELKIFQTHFPT